MTKWYYDIKQRSDEWRKIRNLHFTASEASTIMAMGKGVETLVKNKLAEYYSSGAYEEYVDNYVNKNIQRGVDFEDKAKRVYELENNTEIKDIGFVEMNDNVGCSPDGLVGADGLIEIKNHNDTKFLELLENNKIEKKYNDQIQMQLYVTGRRWCDYFGFNPNFTPCYYQKRIFPDTEIFAKLNESLGYATRLLYNRKIKLDKVLTKGE